MTDLEAQDGDITEKSQLKQTEVAKETNDCYTKEELLQLSNTPCWNLTRRVLLVLFWLCWFGMIVWSVLIVVYAPKCKKEPDQAWFTKGSVAKFNCAVPLEDIATQVGSIEPGQYQGIMAEGCMPSLKELAAGGNNTDAQAKVTELMNFAATKDIKMLFSIDAAEVDELTDEGWRLNVAGPYPADGYILRNADDVTFGMNLSAGVYDDVTFFIEGQADIPNDAFYYKELSADEPLADAKKWIKTTLKVNETSDDVDIDVWTIDGGVETLWEVAQDLSAAKPSAGFIMSTVLPGGFIVPFETVEKDAERKYVGYGNDWRQTHQSLRAISGSVMRWFTRGTGFSRKFDLQPAVEVAVNLSGEDIEQSGIRGRIDSKGLEVKKIYPMNDEDTSILTPGDAQVYIISNE